MQKGEVPLRVVGLSRDGDEVYIRIIEAKEHAVVRSTLKTWHPESRVVSRKVAREVSAGGVLAVVFMVARTHLIGDLYTHVKVKLFVGDVQGNVLERLWVPSP